MPLSNRTVEYEWPGAPRDVDLDLYSGDTYILTLVTKKNTGEAIAIADFPISAAPAVNVSDSNGPVVFASAPTATFTTGSTTVTFSSANTSHLEGRTGLRYDVSASGWTLAAGSITLTQDA